MQPASEEEKEKTTTSWVYGLSDDCQLCIWQTIWIRKSTCDPHTWSVTPLSYHTVILQEGYPHSPLSQRGVPQVRLPPFTTWIPPLKVPGAPCVRGAMKIPAKMAEQSSGVNLSLPVPLSRHFDVMAALCFVMWRSCQISVPVMALSARLLGLTEPVMELRLNKRVITLPVLDHTTLSYTGGGASILCAEGRGGGERVTLQPPSKRRCEQQEKPSDY
ncbi:unnamed protein product [Pleuronectes platessa]|uniref:Uncharacterized protein n=1 Tax=Pleuronectes platessa TaxID=8262 RepID=A0A9N7V8Z2_PLEPL|nr:unnamed protein product [Pleuronectes platessa]